MNLVHTDSFQCDQHKTTSQASTEYQCILPWEGNCIWGMGVAKKATKIIFQKVGAHAFPSYQVPTELVP